MFYKIHVLKSFAKFTEKKPFLELLFHKAAGLKAWNFIKKRLQHRYLPVSFAKFFKKPYLQNTSGWLLLLIPPFQSRFYPLITLFTFFPSFFPFILDNCNYGSLYRKGIKVKINMNVVKTICLGNNLAKHIRENKDFPRQKSRQLASAKANFEGWTIKQAL